MKKCVALILVLTIIAGLFILTSCGKEEKSNRRKKSSEVEIEEVDETDEIDEIATTTNVKEDFAELDEILNAAIEDEDDNDFVEKTESVNEWPEAYRNKLTEIYNCDSSDEKYYQNNSIMFSLIYVNDDDIPELVVSQGDSHAADVELFAYSNGNVIYVDECGSWGELSYSERNGIISDAFVNMGEVSESYEKFNGTELKTLDYFWNNKGSLPEGDDGIEYKVNNISVSKDEYDEKISEYNKYDFVSAGRDYELTPSNISKYCK